MTGETEHDFVATNVLGGLVCIGAACSRSTQQRQPYCLIVRFVRSILTIGQQRNSIRATLVREIDPLMRGDLELSLFFVRPLDGSDVPVVSRQIVRRAERKCRLQICFLRLPIDHVAEFDAIAGVTRRETYRLNELRRFSLAFDFDGHARGSGFADSNSRFARNKTSRRPLLIFEVHIPRGPLPRIVCRYGQSKRSREQFAVELFVEDARHIAFLIYSDAIASIFKR